MKCSNVMELLEELSPPRFAENWDNIGLMTGDRKADVHKIIVSLDGDEAAIDEAVRLQADMIVTHHPLIFKGIKSVTKDSLTGSRIMRLIQNGINLYSMHTNFDIKGGMAELAAKKIGIYNYECLESVCEEEGIGRIGDYPQILTVREWADRIKELFCLPSVVVYGDLEKKVRRISISPGSGKDYIRASIEKRADLFITGDINHHSGIDAIAEGLTVIDASHYGLEYLFVEFVGKYLKEKISDSSIEIIQMERKIPFNIL